MYLVENFRSDALLHQVRTDDADVLVTCDRFCLRYSAFEAVPDKRKRRSFINPLLRNRMSKNKDRYAQRMPTAPSFGEVECPPSCHQGPVVVLVSRRYSAVCGETLNTISVPGSP